METKCHHRAVVQQVNLKNLTNLSVKCAGESSSSRRHIRKKKGRTEIEKNEMAWKEIKEQERKKIDRPSWPERLVF